jgi:hypothetical protein
MMFWKLTGWFFRSVPGILGTFAALATVLAASALGLGLLPALGLGVPVLAIAFLASISTKKGLKSLVDRKDGDMSLKAGKLIGEAAEAAKGMAALRLPDPAIAKMRDALVLESGKFLEDSRARLNGREKTGDPNLPLYDPEAIQAILDAREVLDALLHELDESSSERRFGSQDAHPVENPAERASVVLGEKTYIIRKGRDRIGGLPDFSTRLEIEEELK